MQIIRDIPGKNYTAEVRAIRNWVVRTIRYTRDVNGIETLQTPEKTIEYRQGDCDDHAMLVATLLESIGHPTRFRAIAVNNRQQFTHVFTETKIGPRWVSVETTEDWSIGFIPKNATKSMYEHI